MKQLLTALTVVFLISGCGILGDDGSDKKEKFEPYKIGSWLIEAPNEADYQGVDSKAKYKTSQTDTVVIDQPGQRNLTLIKGGYDDSGDPFITFDMSFVDSTVTKSSNADVARSSFVSPYDTDVFESMHSNQTLGEYRYKAEIGLRFFCERPVQKGYAIQLRVRQSNGAMFRVYTIRQKGFIDVLNDFCNTK